MMFLFQLGDFHVPAVNFQGCIQAKGLFFLGGGGWHWGVSPLDSHEICQSVEKNLQNVRFLFRIRTYDHSKSIRIRCE